MKRNVGVWIDHRRAVIVRITGDVEGIQSIDSDMEKHIRFAGGKPEDQQERKFTNHLNEYYAKIVPFLRDADSILIFGPGEAKGEFEKRFGSESFSARILNVETVDKMTDNQLAAKVREHFLNQAEEIQKNKKH